MIFPPDPGEWAGLDEVLEVFGDDAELHRGGIERRLKDPGRQP